MDVELPHSTEIAERFDSLYQMLSRKYKVHQVTQRISDRKFRFIEVEDIDPILEDLVKRGPEDEAVKDERFPYWAEIWPAAIGLSNFVIKSEAIGEKSHVIELGCGLGLVGMIAAMKGATVLITDYQPDALRFSEMNWLLNLGMSPNSKIMDWRNPDLDVQFDIILASDVVYEKRFFDPLIESFRRLLKPGGHIFLSEPKRDMARRFFKLLQTEGFTYKKYHFPIDYREKRKQIDVYDIWKQ